MQSTEHKGDPIVTALRKLASMIGWLLPNSAVARIKIQATQECIVYCGIPWLSPNSGRDVCPLCSRPTTLCPLFFSAVFAVAAYMA